MKYFRPKSRLEKKFTGIFNNNGFEGVVSKSGKGSDLVQTENIRKELPGLLSDLQVKIFMDAPCGDFYWMREVNLDGIDKYIGVDIVSDIIKINKKLISNKTFSFVHADLTAEMLPQADLVLCRDCLVHLCYSDISKVIRNFQRSKIRYCLTTSFSNLPTNSDLGESVWRPLNLLKEPFNFPTPLRIIDEKCQEQYPLYVDKHLGLWDLQRINF
jgi:hypothetical protein